VLGAAFFSLQVESSSSLLLISLTRLLEVEFLLGEGSFQPYF